MLPVRGADLCVETFGDPDDPAILLISGITGPMDGWDDDLCAALADGGRYVIRYDHRDTGRSTTDPPGQPSYTGDDLTLDPLGILDALGIARAHLVGVSMGGGIAQSLAIDHPDRVASLTLIATTPITSTGRDLPIGAAMRAAFDDPQPGPDWSDPEAVVRHLADGERLYAGPGFDPEQSLAIARRIVARSVDLAAAANHWLVSGGEPGGTLADVVAPTLVLHGAADPFFPLAHGEALAAAVPGARLVVLEGTGHQVPPRSTWDVVVPEIVRHTAVS